MKVTSIALALLGTLAVAAPTMITSASADVVRKTVSVHRGPMGHGCRTVRTVKHGFGGRRVVVRKICG